MITEITLRELEHIIRHNADPSFSGDEISYSALSGALTYGALAGEQQLDPDISHLLGADEYTESLRRTWRTLIANPAHLPCGEIHLKDFSLIGESALCVAADHGLALVGAPLNWGVDYARWYIAQLAKRTPWLGFVDNDRFSLDDQGGAPVDEEGGGLLLASPGSNVYGHWILDYVPRLFLSQYIASEYKQRIIFSTLPSWANVFLEAFEIDPKSLTCLDPTKLIRFSRLCLPSGTKNGFSMAQPLNKHAWLHFRDYIRAKNTLRPRSDFPQFFEKIFLSRRSFGSTRVIENARKLEDIAKDAGFGIVEPEKFDIFTQAEMLLHAKIIVGEDGSALHNVLFSPAGAHLGVIAVAERPNLWHVSLCQAMGQSLSYIVAKSKPDGTREVDEDLFKLFLNAM
jgi:capsular polysaccharide biosynthesis protein